MLNCGENARAFEARRAIKTIGLIMVRSAIVVMSEVVQTPTTFPDTEKLL